ncbi:MAG: trypsin-like serine protease [Caldilineaceae bacterium]
MINLPQKRTVWLAVTTFTLFCILHQTPLLSADQVHPQPLDAHIVGGEDATPGEFPWQVLLDQGCGGSLVAPQWVLTAAHCVTKNNQILTDFTIYLGVHDTTHLDTNVQIQQPAHVFVHPDYADATQDNDLALIQLNSPATINQRVSPLPLLTSPDDDALIQVGALATVAGWGSLQENGPEAKLLQKVVVPIVSNQTCSQSYPGAITNNMLCAGYAAGGKDACQGDSGGALIVPDGHGGWKQVGIVSFGNGCAKPLYYGVYTRVSRYADWISGYITTGTPTATPTVTPSATNTPIQTATPPTPTPRPTQETQPETITLEAEGGIDNIFLNWQPVNSLQVASYRVLREVDATTKLVLTNHTLATDYVDINPVDINPVDINPLDDNTAEAATMQPNTEYCYQVDAVDAQAVVVARSKRACAVFGAVSLWAPKVNVVPNMTALIPINIRNASGLRIVASDIWLNYDATVLAFHTITSTVFSQGYIWQTASTSTPGHLHIQAHPTDPNTPAHLYGSGSLFMLSFTVIGQAGQQSALDLQAYNAISQTGSTLTVPGLQSKIQAVDLHLQSGRVTLAAQPFYIQGDVNGDGQVDQADVAKTVLLIEHGTTYSQTVADAGDVNGNGQLDAGDAAMLAYWVQNWTWPSPSLKEIAVAPKTSKQANILLALRSISGKGGDVIATTLQASNLPASAAGEFVFVYDPATVEAVFGQTDIPNVKSDLYDNGAGLVHVTLISTTPISSQETLFTFTFYLRQTAPLGFSPFLFADATLYDPYGRDLIRSFPGNTLARQNATIQVQTGEQKLYLPVVRSQ